MGHVRTSIVLLVVVIGLGGYTAATQFEEDLGSLNDALVTVEHDLETYAEELHPTSNATDLFTPTTTATNNTNMMHNTTATITTTTNNPSQLIDPLGANSKARLAAHASLGLTFCVGHWFIATTIQEILAHCAYFLPFLKEYAESKRFSLVGAFPLSLMGLINYGPVVDYFFYILYAGERVSPVLARDVLYDIRVYIEHIQTLKNIQQQLIDIINQLNEFDAQNTTTHSTQKSPGQLVGRSLHVIAQKLSLSVAQHEKRIQEFITQISEFLTSYEIPAFKVATECYSVAADLKDETQAIIVQLQSSITGLGTQAPVINSLLNKIINYWRQYVDGLASDIVEGIKFCQTIYHVESFVTHVLVRPLVSI